MPDSMTEAVADRAMERARMADIKLTGNQRSELYSLGFQPGLWRGVEPFNSDEDLHFYLRHGLAVHLGAGLGYAITDAGRRSLSSEGRKDA
jgi:hypothetical protein